jgi:hypothetical protein
MPKARIAWLAAHHASWTLDFRELLCMVIVVFPLLSCI